ncbi:hypothetical protein MHYP_G00305810 [Metynnis hypsauchen]
MDALKVLSIVLVVLHVVDAAVIPCTWTQFRLRDLNEESIMLLEKMGASMPLRCLEDGWRALPDDVFLNAQNEDLAVVALETLRGVDRIFKNDQTSVTWDRETLGLFKNIISSRQVENLQKCVGEDASQSAVGSLSAGSSVGQLKSYFEELQEKLRVKVSSMPTKCQLQRTLVAKTHNLLETMTGPFPLQCLDDIPVEIRSPTWALQSNNSKQDVVAAKAVYKTLMKVSSLMENDGFPQSWDAEKLVKFQIIVDRQIEESECIMRIKTKTEEDDFPVRDAALTDYFEKVEKLLKEKEFSVCGWEVVRRELLSVLQFILEKNSKDFWPTRV